MNRIEKSHEFHGKGFNCAQSVVLAYHDLFDIDLKTAIRASEAFGAGMGGRETTCGALSGAVMLAGLKHSDGNADAPASKMTTYSAAAQIVEEFKKRCGDINCCDIKVNNRVTCGECITCGAELVEEFLLK